MQPTLGQPLFLAYHNGTYTLTETDPNRFIRTEWTQLVPLPTNDLRTLSLTLINASGEQRPLFTFSTSGNVSDITFYCVTIKFAGESPAMIRELRKADINQVADIWLDTNIKAHYFISAQYWKSNLELVKELLLQATVYVYEDNQKIQGFIGLNGEYIEGIFVSEAMQSQSIGKILLNYVKNTRSKLILNVYQNNTPAISFYQREGFEIQYSGLDEATGEKDYRMAWQQK